MFTKGQTMIEFIAVGVVAFIAGLLMPSPLQRKAKDVASDARDYTKERF